MNNLKISAGTIARTAAIAVTLANTFLTAAGKNPLPFSETATYEFVSNIALGIATIVAWWKNNSFTAAAIHADNVMHSIKEEK